MAHFRSVLYLIILALPCKAQLLHSIKGNITDKASGAPVAYATVILKDTQPLLGGTSDSSGNFLISNVAVGRYDIKLSCLGYEDIIVREVTVSSVKQTFISVSMKENTKTLDEVVIAPSVNKEQPLNSMATVSARMLSVDEAKRYAGGFDDPARLASAFAGVASNSGFNGIIVRGNAPKYLQWKMEGVEILNPNHFGDLKSFGGGILTGLSSQMLANSDFLSGAFPAEYNNALSGVFDIAMRKGNTARKERTAQIGLIGLDYSEEGSFVKNGKASYLFNYRNSTLALLEPLLPENAEKIKYQDLSFKLHFPTSKAGVFSVWGIGLSDAASAKAKTDSTKWFYAEDKQKNDITMQVGAMGLTHTYFFNSRAYLKTTIAATGSNSDWKAQILNNQLELKPYSRITYRNWNYTLTTCINKKFSARHTNRTGFTATNMNYNILLNRSIIKGETPVEIVNSKGNTYLLSAYSNSSVNLTRKLTLNIGINGQFFTLNNHYTIEPRIGLKQILGSKQTIGVGYGLHSRLENLNFYYNNALATGEKAVNKNLDFTKAHHFVLSYDLSISEHVHLRVEPYYQKLFSVPVVNQTSFSFMNLQSDWFFDQKLQNTGEGQNYGLDITLEKYMSNGYYGMFTCSVFDSKYKGGDGVWRNTRFNRNFVVNMLAGKEWYVGKNKQNVFSINLRVSWQGGNRYSPINEAASYTAKEIIYDDTKAYSLQSAPLINFHFSTGYKINRQNTSHEFSLKILNATGQKDFYGYKFNYIKNTFDKDESSVVLPNLSYKIEF